MSSILNFMIYNILEESIDYLEILNRMADTLDGAERNFAIPEVI